MMKVQLFDFDLPEQLIAQTPLHNRVDSRLLILNRQTGAINHNYFKNVINYFKKGDCLVLNDTRVLPARLFGVKDGTGGKVEVLLLKQVDGENEWETLVKPARRVPIGTKLIFGNGDLTAVCVGKTATGGRRLQFSFTGIFYEILEQLGEMPLPPYIKEQLTNNDRYQTVYAKEQGSAAAPTAGLHFTTELLEQLKLAGVKIVYLTLHVGLGTFRPVSVANVSEHKMHAEYYYLSEQNAQLLNETKAAGGRIITVGTTSTRTIETVARQNEGQFSESSGWTDIFIYPPYEFKAVDAILTNFHLPKSTLIMLISAFASREKVMAAYEEAIDEQYRFFSFGDAMLII